MSTPLLVSPHSCLDTKHLRFVVWGMRLERIIITDTQLDCSSSTSCELVCDIQTGKKTDSSMRFGVTSMDLAYYSNLMRLSIQSDDPFQKHTQSSKQNILVGDYV